MAKWDKWTFSEPRKSTVLLRMPQGAHPEGAKSKARRKDDKEAVIHTQAVWPSNRFWPIFLRIAIQFPNTSYKLPMSFTWDYMPAYCDEGVPWCEWVASPRQMPQMSRPFSLLHPRPPCLSSFLSLLILLLSFMFHFLIGIQIERETRSSSYLMNFNTITFLPFICSAFFHFDFKCFNFGCISCLHLDY